MAEQDLLVNAFASNKNANASANNSFKEVYSNNYSMKDNVTQKDVVLAINRNQSEQEDLLEGIVVNTSNMRKQATGIQGELLVHDEVIKRINGQMDSNTEKGGIINKELTNIQKQSTCWLSMQILLFLILDIVMLWW
eukprot:CAMPEP_0116925492 /NCGR_PEP_ID=MMETSP0467-20121206/24156_1 /TAXON_ID=283647 /ORGANISM="Mesodinium pulex, Strain SPMC105" /LENGTH=136 /DNA_ID=CAMNT_0004604557 /DNA_START=265 /DNA_END=672 /DNA_ORIENTATION=-